MTDTAAETKWVPGKWEDVKPGDSIKLEHEGGSVLFAVATINPNGSYTSPLGVEVANRIVALTAFIGHGWALFAAEKPTPAFPTAAGWYRDYQGDTWRLSHHGEWTCFESPGDNGRPADYGPFALLEPVPKTAKKVLERLASFWEFGPPKHIATEIASVAAEFGVVPE